MKIFIDKPHSIIHQGQRLNQEDCIYPESGKATSDDRFFILCDGMGGHDSGEVASSTVCEKMSQWLRENITDDRPITKEIVISALDAAYDGLDEKDNPNAAKKMGTTMTFVMFHREGCTVAHIGDSRVYHISPSTKSIRHTIDHSLVNDLLKCEEITEEEAATSKIRNVITRAMQPHQERRSKPDVEIIDHIYPGDYFYMCSDGMLEKMSDEEIYRLIANAVISDEEKVSMLLSETKDNKDNHSAHLIRISRVCNDDGTDIVMPATQDLMGEVEIDEKDANHYMVPETSHHVDLTKTKPAEKDKKVPAPDPVKVNKDAEPSWRKIIRIAVYSILLFISAYLIAWLFFYLQDHSVQEIINKIMQLGADNQVPET